MNQQYLKFKNMNCPYCNEELQFHDEYYTGRPENYYGTAGNGIYYPSTKKHLGDIFKCKNEECEYYDTFFYTDTNDNLNEGFPC